MLDIESLRYELVKVANAVEKHSLVAAKQGISTTYLSQIRKGTNVTLDNTNNKELISRLITTYRELGKEKINSITIALK
jgi:hypothetical protein